MFETHIHNDYVTGGLALAREVGAQYLVNADDEVSYERTPVRDDQVVEVGDTMRVRAIHTPGHTHTHLSYALEAGGEQIAVFTGGSLLYGTTGRPDLLGRTTPTPWCGPSGAPPTGWPRNCRTRRPSTPPTGSARSAPRPRPPVCPAPSARRSAPTPR